jgi:hypothetical protein
MRYLKLYNTETKSYTYHVTLNEHVSFKLKEEFNSISGTYGGINIDIDICNLRGLLRALPNFVEDFNWCNADRSLQEYEFQKQTEPTQIQSMLYIKDNILVK